MTTINSNNDRPVHIRHMPINDEFMLRLPPHSPREVAEAIEVFVTELNGEHSDNNWWGERCATVPILTIVGETGVGKSTVVRNTIHSLGGEIRRIPVGEGLFEDLAPTVDLRSLVSEDCVHTRQKFAEYLPVSKPKKFGVVMIDDMARADTKQQSAISALATEGFKTGWFGVRIPDGWHYIATMNPPTAKYFLSHEIEESLRNRMIVIRMVSTPRQTVEYLDANGALSRGFHKFLMKDAECGGEFMSRVTPRYVEIVAAMILRAERNEKPFSTVLKMFGSALDADLIERLKREMSDDLDPDSLPITAREIIAADESQMQRICSALDKWCRDGSDSLIAMTAYDIQSKLRDARFEIHDEGVINLAKTASCIRRVDLLESMLNSMPSNSKRVELFILHISPAAEDLVVRAMKAWRQANKSARRNK